MSYRKEGFPLPILTPRLRLQRPDFSPEGVECYARAVEESRAELMLWIPWARYPATHEQVRINLESYCSNWEIHGNNGLDFMLWITSRETQQFLGSITMWNILWELPKFELGFWMRSSQAGQGYMSEAVNAVTRYLLAFGAARIEIRCESENLRAQTIPQYLGYRLDGVMPHGVRAIRDGHLTDVMMFSRVDSRNLPELEVEWGDGTPEKGFLA